MKLTERKLRHMIRQELNELSPTIRGSQGSSGDLKARHAFTRWADENISGNVNRLFRQLDKTLRYSEYGYQNGTGYDFIEQVYKDGIPLKGNQLQFPNDVTVKINRGLETYYTFLDMVNRGDSSIKDMEREMGRKIVLENRLNEANLTNVREYRDFKYGVKRMVDRYINSELDAGNQMTGNYLIDRAHQKISEMMYDIIQEHIYDMKL